MDEPVIQHLVISWVAGEAYMSGPPQLTTKQYQEALAAIKRYQHQPGVQLAIKPDSPSPSPEGVPSPA